MVFHMISFYIRSLTNKMKAEDFEIKVEEGNEEVCCFIYTSLIVKSSFLMGQHSAYFEIYLHMLKWPS